MELKKENYRTKDLLDIMEFLRGGTGCPWDREQTHESIKRNVVEEAYEVVDAIESEDPKRLYDELGDLLLQIVFHSRIAEENGEFTYYDVVKNICEKLISRHTHIFGEKKETADSAEEVLKIWDNNKNKEKNLNSVSDSMQDVPRSFPALLRAYKIQKKAAKTGFDWDDIKCVEEKIIEEMNEVKQASQKKEKNKNALQEELGDLLFSVVNYARFMEIDPELALDRANEKFIDRFKAMENIAKKSGVKIEEMDLEGMNRLWEKVKKKGKAGKKRCDWINFLKYQGS